MLTEEEQDSGYYYKYNEKVLFRTDSKTQMEYLKNGVQGTIIKPNEARRKLDYPDAEGGNELYANGNIVPLTMAGAAYTKPQTEPEQPEKQTEETEESQEETGETVTEQQDDTEDKE